MEILSIPAVDEIFTIEPFLDFLIRGIDCFSKIEVAINVYMCNVFSQSFDFNFSSEPVGPAIPTLLIKASIFFVFFLTFIKKI